VPPADTWQGFYTKIITKIRRSPADFFVISKSISGRTKRSGDDGPSHQHLQSQPTIAIQNRLLAGCFYGHPLDEKAPGSRLRQPYLSRGQARFSSLKPPAVLLARHRPDAA
jgi:hypothetical protein